MKKSEDAEETEMADISLLGTGRSELPEESHSWYSANGRGYSVNGRQTEYEGDTSHVATVLGEDFYSKQKRNQAIKHFISQRPHPAFNIPAVGTFEPSSLLYDYRGWNRQIESQHGAVAADHGRCSVIGVGVLQAGGNAVDAAIATCLCQGVISPVASGIGGGNFMLIRLPNGTAEFIDAREVAPSAANETMFVGRPPAAQEGGLAIAVPMELQGLWLAHQRYGKASWKSLVQPAINLAELGFSIHPYLSQKISDHLANFQEDPALRDVFLVKEGSQWRAPKVNETCCVRPQLASLLREVAEQGPDALYNSSNTEALAADIQAAGGIITVKDLQNARAVSTPALETQAFGLNVSLTGLPSSAVATALALHILEGYPDLAFSGALATHRIVEALKTAFALRTHLADPGDCSNSSTCFANMSLVVDKALSVDFANQLRSKLLDNATQSTDQYGGELHANASLPQDSGTSHMSVIDQDGMAVSMTSTVNKAFGSYVYSQSTGILLNDQMDDFSIPGSSNTFGLAPGAANFVRPGKRPLSSMSPMIFSDESGVRICVGASGGPRIISTMVLALVRMIVQGQAPLAAIDAPRLHHQLLPDTVVAEQWSSFNTPNSTISVLESRGHNVSFTDWNAAMQAIVVDPTTRTLVSAADPRKDGAPDGY